MKKIVELQTTNKGNFGICEYSNGKRVFFKQCNYDIGDELRGYDKIKDKYNVPKRIYFDEDKNIIVYEFNENLYKKTLHYGLYEEGQFEADKIVDMLTRPFSEIKQGKAEDCVNSKFYRDRLHMLDNYLQSDNELFSKDIVIDKKNYGSFRDVLKRIKQTIETEGELPVVETQGDPTDLNIGVNAEITDYEVAGTNSVSGEVAIFLGCFILNSYYYYIKYVNSSHKLYTHTMQKYGKMINPTYVIDDDKIDITMRDFVPEKNKELIMKYLNQLKQYKELQDNPSLGKYIAFRFMSPVNLLNINDEKDLIALMYVATRFESVMGVDDTINFVKEM